MQGLGIFRKQRSHHTGWSELQLGASASDAGLYSLGIRQRHPAALWLRRMIARTVRTVAATFCLPGDVLDLARFIDPLTEHTKTAGVATYIMVASARQLKVSEVATGARRFGQPDRQTTP